MKSVAQLKEITGLKGMAALIVMLSHYTIAFFPAVWNAEYQLEHIPNVEKFIHRTPLYFFSNGSLMVSVFWCISGFLLGYAWFQNKSIQLLKKRIVGRYFKLVIPITISMIIAYVCHVCNFFYNNTVAAFTWSEWLTGFYQFEPSLLECIFEGLFGSFFIGIVKYNPVLWTIQGEVFGICISSLFLVTLEKRKKQKNVICYLLAIIVSILYQPLLSFFIGILVSKKYLQGVRISKTNLMVCFGFALVLGSFLPIWGFIPAEIMCLNSWSLSIGDIFRSISAGLLLICTLNSVFIKNILSKKIFWFLGNISMYLYIYHFVIMCSFSCWFFVFINTYIEKGYVCKALLSILSGITVTILWAVLLKKTIDIVNRKLLEKVYLFLKLENREGRMI